MSVSRIAKWVLLAAIATAAGAFVYVFVQSAYWNSTLLKCASPDPAVSEAALSKGSPRILRREPSGGWCGSSGGRRRIRR